MKISDLRIVPKVPMWCLYVEKFPLCVPEGLWWDSNHGIDVVFRILEKATEKNEGEMIITFRDHGLEKTIRKFISAWETGTYDPKTGKSHPMNELSMGVKIIDGNNLEQNKDIMLKFPTRCGHAEDTPSVQAVYYNN